MMDNTSMIGPLKKISLKITAADSEVSSGGGQMGRSVEFIFGVGVNGLTHFEYMIADKHVGDEIVVPVRKNDGPHLFGRLYQEIPQFPGVTDPVYLHISISRISEPTPREVVRAMADAAACGSDCGCGCGSH